MMTPIHFVHTLRAELTKTLSLRSIHVVLAAAFVVPAMLALASGLAFDPSRRAQFPLESHGFETAGFGQPLVILLAALITGTEYLDGQLRTTLLATPRRGRVLTAKLLLVGLLATLIGFIAIGTSVIIKHAVIGEHGLGPTELTVRIGWNLLGVSVNYALIGLLAAGITILARSYVVTLIVLVPLVLGITVSLLGAVPVLKFLPDLAGIQLLMPYPGVGVLDPIPGGLVMACWAASVAGAAWATFRTRDTAAG
jgi:ABC-2 type transport system permease protein